MAPDILTQIVLGAWVLVAAFACFGVYNVQRDRPPLVIAHPTGMVLIIPIRGIPAHFDALWRGICEQTDRPCRVIFAIENAQDPILPVLQALSGGPVVEIVMAGPTTHHAQKVHNQLAALRVLHPDETIIAFADADVVPDPNWLARLLRNFDQDSMASGYRWMVPTDDRWATMFVCAINSSVATIPRRAWSLAWGGSMVIHRKTLEALPIEKCWDRAVLDDLPLTRCMKARGIPVRAPRDCLVHSPVSYGWMDALAFGRRQYMFIRTHSPLHWAMAATATTVPLLGWVVALPLAIKGSVPALGVIVAANALDHLRAYFRRRVGRKLWGTEMARPVAWLDSWGTPAVLAVHALVIWSALFGRSIYWAGRTYWVNARGDVVRVETSDA